MPSNSFDNCPQVQISLQTKDDQYAVPDTPLSVPLSVDPGGLNSLVLSLLPHRSTSDSVTFAFLIDGEMVAGPLADWLQESGRCRPEHVLTVEYVRATAVPRPLASLAHDDWLSCVRVARGSHIVSGSYDGTLHLWRSSGEHRLTVPAHGEAVKCLDLVAEAEPAAAPEKEAPLTLVSGGMDQLALLWRCVGDHVECVTAMKGHAKSVDCVSAWDTGLIASGSWDTNIMIWQPSLPSATSNSGAVDGDSSISNNNGGSRKQKRPRRAPELQASSSLTDHAEAVSGLDWLARDRLASVSWDHTLLVWDVEAAAVVWRWAGHKALFSVSGGGGHLLLTTAADRHVRLCDQRSQGVQAQFTSHSGWVTSVCWHRGGGSGGSEAATHFVSCGIDGLVKMWDVRCQRAPLYDLHGHTERATGCHWGGNNGALVASCSVDKTVKLFSTGDIV